MDPRTRQLLLDADDPVAYEFPAGFDWTRAMTRVRALVPSLEAIVGRPLTVDGNVQDAAFFTEVACHREVSHPGMGRVLEPVIAVRFSCFGDLFTVISAAGVAPSVLEQVIARVADAGAPVAVFRARSQRLEADLVELRGHPRRARRRRGHARVARALEHYHGEPGCSSETHPRASRPGTRSWPWRSPHPPTTTERRLAKRRPRTPGRT